MFYSGILSCFFSVSDVYFNCFMCIEMYVASIVFGYFKSKSDITFCSRIAFGWLTSMSPLSLSVGWASEPEVQVGVAPSPFFSMLVARHGMAAWRETGRRNYTQGARSFCSV